MEDSDKAFATMMRFIKWKRSEVKELIQDQEKAAVSQAEGLLKQVEQEIVELKRRDAKLERFSHTEDHIHFLQVRAIFLRFNSIFYYGTLQDVSD